MAAAPLTDPWKPIDESVRGMRALAVVLLLMSPAGAVLVVALQTAGAMTRSDWMLAAATVASAAPGASLLVLAWHLHRRRRWAAVAAVWIVAPASLFIAFLLLPMTWVGMANSDEWSRFLILPFDAAIVYALGRLDFQVFRSIRAIDQLDGTRDRGFEPILAVPPTAPPAVPLREQRRHDLD